MAWKYVSRMGLGSQSHLTRTPFSSMLVTLFRYCSPQPLQILFFSDDKKQNPTRSLLFPTSHLPSSLAHNFSLFYLISQEFFTQNSNKWLPLFLSLSRIKSGLLVIFFSLSLSPVIFFNGYILFSFTFFSLFLGSVWVIFLIGIFPFISLWFLFWPCACVLTWMWTTNDAGDDQREV